MRGKIDLRNSFMLAPVPVVLVGCSHEKLGDNVLTIAWCGVDCSDPPIIHISIRPDRYSHRMIKESGCFTVNIPTCDLLGEIDLCGTVSGREGDKFERSGLTPKEASIVSAPIIDECPVNIECTVRDVITLGLHDMFLGEIVAKRVHESCLTGGKLDVSKIPLVAYCNGEYWSLGRRIGRYGCSAMRR